MRGESLLSDSYSLSRYHTFISEILNSVTGLYARAV